MRRARQHHQKQERRGTILSIAEATLSATPYRDITMTQIAEQAGLVKGTLYLYFATKEELFLEVFRNQLHGWFWDLETSLAELPRRGRIPAVARLIADTTMARPAFRKLLVVLQDTLEANLPERTTAAYQAERTASAAAIGLLLGKAVPGLAPDQGHRLLLRILAWIIGLQSTTRLASASQPDVQAELREGIEALIQGARSQ